MTDRKTLHEGLTSAMWGFILLTLDIKLGTVSILPAFAGWLLLASAASELAEERRDLRLLKPLCRLMALWMLGDWLLSWGGGTIQGHVVFLDLLSGAVNLYFRFQFLTDMARLAQAHWEEGRENLAAKFLLWRTVQTLLMTAVVLCGTLPKLIGGRAEAMLSTAVVCLGVVFCIASLAVVLQLIYLRDWFREDTDKAAGEELTQ